MESVPGSHPELVAPAGNIDKLKTAFRFGADACYLGLKGLSLRAYAGNFDWDELEAALHLARDLGKRIYVTLNVLAGDKDLSLAETSFRRLRELKPHGVVVGDAGILRLGRLWAPDLPLHLSTQLSVANRSAARFWFDQGISRIVLARELSIDQIGALVAGGGDFEVFAHGAICIAHSGRCFLSLYWAHRDASQGACAQACRWPYVAIEDSRRPGLPNPVSEDKRGTYFFDAKDLCSLPVLDRLVATGVRALKLEGRTRSEYYVGLVTDVYRTGLTLLGRSGPQAFQGQVSRLLGELRRHADRGLSTQFLTGVPDEHDYNPQGGAFLNRNEFLGLVEENRGDGVVLTLRNRLLKGQEVELRAPGLSVESTVSEHLCLSDGTPLDMGRYGDRVLLPGSFSSGAGALVRLKETTVSDSAPVL